MKKTIKYILISFVIIIAVIALAGMYKFNYLAHSEGYDCDGNKIIIDHWLRAPLTISE